MQTNLLSFFSSGSQPQKSTVDEELLSEPTKECSEQVHSDNKATALFGSSESDSALSQEEETAPVNEESGIGKRNLRSRESVRKRRRNHSGNSDTEMESISPTTKFVKSVPPASQGELPGAPRKTQSTSRRPRAITEFQELLAQENSQEDLLEDKFLKELDNVDLSFAEHLEEEVSTAGQIGCIEQILDAAKTSDSDMGVDASLVFDRSTAERQSIGRQQGSAEQLLNYYLYRLPHLRHDLMWTKFVECYYRYRHVFAIPSWCDPEKMRDTNNRRVDDEQFDFSRIAWPGPNGHRLGVDDKMHFTPAMQQYWEIKSSNFDTIVFFKLGKFYELFYTDSMIAQELLGLKWMGNDCKAHVGFPESSLSLYGKQLVDHGYKVCVVEQMETPDELQQRKSIGMTEQSSTVKRSICEVYTQGTLTHEKMLDALPSYLSSIYIVGSATSKELQIAIINHDVACCQGYFRIMEEKEYETLSAFHNFISQWAPKEILLDGTASPHIMQKAIELLKSLNTSPQIRPQKIPRTESTLIAISNISKRTSSENDLVKWLNANDTNEACVRAAEQLIDHLDRVLLTERIMSCSSFKEFDKKDQCLSLTAASMHTLDIFPGLFNKINFTSTKGGYRMLRQWLGYPLLDSSAITQRQKSVTLLYANARLMNTITKELSGLPDLERQFGRLASQILKGGSEASGGGKGPVYFSETINKRISEYAKFLRHLQHIDKLLEELKREVPFDDPDCRFSKLVHEVYPHENILSLLDSCLTRINLQCNLPSAGESEEYDMACATVHEIEQSFDMYLNHGIIWRELGVAQPAIATYVSCKYRYEVEVEEHVWKKIKNESVSMTSCRKGYVRFHTGWIHNRLSDLQRAEYDRDQYLYPWLAKEIRRLHSYSPIVNHALNMIAEIDCLNSLAIYGQQLQPLCMPQIDHGRGESDAYIQLKMCYHPILANSKFIPNDIRVSSHQSIILTGPNMGGKSTLSRQVALLTILAQIGSFIPAESCQLRPFHQIFTRIGLRDALAQSKSTFLIELEDVMQMIKYASKRALLIVDEFGRGTNSKEGAVLAASTLFYLTQRIQCAVLFSTHFPLQYILQLLAEETPDLLRNIAYKHLGAIVSLICFSSFCRSIRRI